MNSIRRPRRRPRRESYNFRTLWWLVTREAALRICYRASMGTDAERAARVQCSDRDTVKVRVIAWGILNARPERRFFP